ncbi:hypothetical protein K488DRAFT_88932 [Vararia minispora EC-137]|uniref:Uncharacterized protein n=1 Tax=Vararia minispora EC-137 TaxID=1314806 RepID=A0ACB8QBW6_9AGAM|nr:hypothetical protein K488DRAFT_88932 [Vararia minispora EC-137]
MASTQPPVSMSSSQHEATNLPRLVVAPNDDSEEWIRNLIHAPITEVDADVTVEEACDLLLSRNVPCLAVKSSDPSPLSFYSALFDFADVNAFLTFAATRHTYTSEFIDQHPRIAQILDAAKAGRVPVSLVSNLSEKNPLVELSHDANIIDLLGAFSNGVHRVLVKAPEDAPGPSHLGIVTDTRLLSYFATFARPSTPSGSAPSSPISFSPTPLSSGARFSPVSPSIPSSTTFQRYLGNTLQSLPLPSLNLYTDVIALRARADSVLDAMRMMSELGVSSVAVLDDETGSLLSAVSVTDIGRFVVPSQSNAVLHAPLQQLVAQIKLPDGWADGADRFPVYSVLPSTTLSYTMQKLLTTGAHRVFVTGDLQTMSPPNPSSPTGELIGVASIVDILSLFAILANVPNVDPTRMQRHRRASSASSQGSESGAFVDLSRRGLLGNKGSVHLARSGSVWSSRPAT